MEAHGAGDGMLCIGCLEKRIGRKLRRQDFTDCPLNEITETKSLRLQDRLSLCLQRLRHLPMIVARCHILIADRKTDSMQHRARILDGTCCAVKRSSKEGTCFSIYLPKKWKEWKQKPHR